jgi:hypothetical protein
MDHRNRRVARHAPKIHSNLRALKIFFYLSEIQADLGILLAVPFVLDDEDGFQFYEI